MARPVKTCMRFAIAALISCFAVAPVAHAQLPSLNEQPWMGYFAAFKNKRYQFGLSAQGDIKLTPMGDRGDPVSFQIAISILAGIEETMPDGKITMRQIKIESLETKDAATDELEKVSLRGKVTGDAAFEMNLEQTRGIVFIGGRILDPGTLTKNPIRFVVRVKFPTAYPNDKKAQANIDPKDDKKADKATKAFLKKIEDDQIDLKWTDGKRVKQDMGEEVDAASKELNGPGISSAEVEIAAYKGKRLLFTAAPNSAMTLKNDKPGPLHEGFTINWLADTAKDTEGKARLAIEVK